MTTAPAISAPAISVIVPHYNAGDALARCLSSLAAQQGAPPFEVIVVDNGSARRPVAEVAAQGFARLVDEPTPGPGPARSHGAHLAQAPLLAFIDSDCMAAPGWLAAIADHFGRHPQTGVIGGDVRIALADPARPTAIEAYESIYGYRMKLYVQRDGYTASCNMAVRRSVFAAVGDFGGIGIAEDVDWGQRASAQGVRIDYVPEMRIATPARSSFAELARKWDRHIGHDFAEAKGMRGRARFAARALALGLSPAAEALVIARSDRVSGVAARLRALACLTRIRLYRCRRMLALALGQGGRSAAGAWRNG